MPRPRHFGRRCVGRRAQRGDQPDLLERLRARFEPRPRADQLSEGHFPRPVAGRELGVMPS